MTASNRRRKKARPADAELLGPISTSFEGSAKVVFDDQAWCTSIDGTGVDRRGGSRGRVSVVCNITAQPDGTHVSVDAELLLSGALAQFGLTGLINEISAQLIGDFVGCLEAKLRAECAVAATIAAAPPRGFTLPVGGLLAWLKKPFRRSEG